MFNTILVGTDAADKGRKAVTVGEALAQITGDRLLLVAVRPDPLVDIPALHVADQIAQREELAHRLRALRDELAPGASTGVQPAVSVAHGLRIAAKRERAGLVVMGVSARRTAAR